MKPSGPCSSRDQCSATQSAGRVAHRGAVLAHPALDEGAAEPAAGAGQKVAARQGELVEAKRLAEQAGAPGAATARPRQVGGPAQAGAQVAVQELRGQGDHLVRGRLVRRPAAAAGRSG